MERERSVATPLETAGRKVVGDQARGRPERATVVLQDTRRLDHESLALVHDVAVGGRPRRLPAPAPAAVVVGGCQLVARVADAVVVRVELAGVPDARAVVLRVARSIAIVVALGVRAVARIADVVAVPVGLARVLDAGAVVVLVRPTVAVVIAGRSAAGVAGISDAVVVLVGLARVGGAGTVVVLVPAAVSVVVARLIRLVTCVADPVVVGVGLVRVGDARAVVVLVRPTVAVVIAGRPTVGVARVPDAVAV